jgi:hypothetical protein
MKKSAHETKYLFRFARQNSIALTAKPILQTAHKNKKSTDSNKMRVKFIVSVYGGVLLESAHRIYRYKAPNRKSFTQIAKPGTDKTLVQLRGAMTDAKFPM